MTLRLCIGASIIGTLLLGSQAFAEKPNNKIAYSPNQCFDLPAIVHDINCDHNTAEMGEAIACRDSKPDLFGIVVSPDIPLCVFALTGIEDRASAYPGCDTRNVDVNGDGAIDGLNVASFTEVLVGTE